VAAIAAKGDQLATDDQKVALNLLGNRHVTFDTLTPYLALKTANEKARWQAIFDDAAKDIQEKALNAKKATESAPLCSDAVHDALKEIAKQQALIANANSKSSDKNKAPADPGATPAPSPPNPTVVSPSRVATAFCLSCPSISP
jgi:hypothetical protein